MAGLHERYPGILVIGYAQVVAARDLEAHIRTVRSQGFSDYSVYPAGERAQYTSIVYVEIIAEYLDGHAFDLTLIEDGELHPNGRGIAVARHVSFRTLQINEAGNEVVVTLTTIP